MSADNVYEAPKSDVTVASVDFEYAGFWVRAVASIIDSVLLMIVIMPLIFLFYGDSIATGTEPASMGFMGVFLNYILPAVACMMFWRYKAATPGKMLMGLKVVSLKDGSELSFGQIVIRYIGYYLSTIVLFLGFVWVAFDKRKQGLHDKISQTTVVKARA